MLTDRKPSEFRATQLQQVPVISIVDDDESVREATKSLVRSLGYKAMTFGSAEEFLNSAHLTTTACLISDVQMPGLSGVELQDRLIADGHRMPVIFVTAFPDDRLRGRVLKSGAIGYLPKPFNEDRLIECIDTALKGPNGRSAGH
jgi:FixJ family two-component response regulator